MKITKKEDREEKLVLIAMIVDKVVLGRICSKWQPNLFRNRYANIIANWCIDFYRQYEKPPMAHVESIYETWAEEVDDKKIVQLIEKFLESLNRQYKTLKHQSNSDYLIDLAGTYFNRVKLERLVDVVEGDLDRGKVEKANNNVTSFNHIELGGGEGIDVLQNKEAIREAFDQKSDPLIIYPGDLGKFFKDSFERDGFVAFLGREKVGKSWWLLDVAYRGLMKRRKVAFFEAGDNSQHQIMRRFMVRASRHPLFPQKIYYPIKIKINKEENYQIQMSYKKKTFKKPLTYAKAVKSCKFLMKKRLRTKNPLLKLSCHPNSSLSVQGIKSILQQWEIENWVPDIIIIDYADILDMSWQGLEGRDRINNTWKQLRSLSQTYHCLVVTATQADADAYDKQLLTEKNFSEDKRKAAHVTGMLGINQTEDEKEQGITRLNWIFLRERSFNKYKCVCSAGNLWIGNPAIKSSF